jgi:hypothetical protein
MMSIIILASNGLVPLSQAISGAVSKWNLNALFVPAGALVLLVTLWVGFHPEFKTLSENLAINKTQEGTQLVNEAANHQLRELGLQRPESKHRLQISFYNVLSIRQGRDE